MDYPASANNYTFGCLLVYIHCGQYGHKSAQFGHDSSLLLHQLHHHWLVQCHLVSEDCVTIDYGFRIIQHVIEQQD